MHKFATLPALFVALSLSAWSQEPPRAEIFAGYSFVSAGFPANTDPAAGEFRGSLNGWNGAAAFNVNRALGVVADFGGYYGSPTKGTLFKPANCVLCTGNATAILHNIHTFTFGPQVSFRSHDLTVFAHGLFGGAHISEDMDFFGPLPKISATSFAVMVGGGFDLRLSPRWAVRLQPDYLRTKILDRPENNFRVSTGLVFRVGK